MGVISQFAPTNTPCAGLLLSVREALIERDLRQDTGIDVPRLEAERCQITLPALVENRAIADVELQIVAEHRLLQRGEHRWVFRLAELKKSTLGTRTQDVVQHGI